MKCVILSKSSIEGYKVIELPAPGKEKGYALININSACLNRRDYWSIKGAYPGLRDGVILGSDAAGRVIAVGCEEGSSLLNKDVLIDPIMNISTNPKLPSFNYKVLGASQNGVFANIVKVPYKNVLMMPSHLNYDQACCLPIAGITAYNAVMNCGNIESGQNVLITGIGGGVAQYAAMFSKIVGARVYVSTGSEKKMELANKQGYIAYNYRDDHHIKKLKKDCPEYFDVIIDGAGGDSLPNLLTLLKIQGKYITYGATASSNVTISIPSIFFGQYKIIGCTLGSRMDMNKMIDFVSHHEIVPLLDSVYSIAEMDKAIGRIANNDHFGKVVVRFG